MKVAIFRPLDYIDDTRKLLEDLGFEVLAVPMIGIERNNIQVRDADYTIITSQTSARIALQENLLRGKIIAIGPKTAEVLGMECLIPSKYDSKTLYEEFKDRLAGKKVNLIRSDKGDPVLNRLAEICDFVEYQIYRIIPLEGEEQRKAVREVAEGRVDAVVFSSSMIVASFMRNAELEGVLLDVVNRLNSILTVAIGPPTAKKLEEYGVKAVMPEEYTMDGVIRLLKAMQRP